MSTLFDVPTPEADSPDPVESWGIHEPATEADMMALLRRRYTFVSAGASRYAYASHVPDSPIGASSIVDFLALDCWRSSGYAIHGHEVKVSRSDWLAERRNADKSLFWRERCHYWWLVVSGPEVVRDDVMPPGWGLMVRAKTGLRAIVAAPKQEPRSLSAPTTVAVMRALHRTIPHCPRCHSSACYRECV